ncbi:unnamed protein product, partial [Polarella glacialis]
MTQSASAELQLQQQQQQRQQQQQHHHRQHQQQQPQQQHRGERIAAASHSIGLAAASPCIQPKKPKWRIRNLTHEVELCLGNAELKRAKLEHQRLEEARSFADQDARRVRADLGSALSVHGRGPLQGETLAEMCKLAERQDASASCAWAAGQDTERELRRQVVAMPPGPELVSASEELRAVHAELGSLQREAAKTQRQLEGARNAVRANRDLHLALAKQAECARQLAAVKSRLKCFQSDPVLTELVRAEGILEDVPPVVVHVKASKELVHLARAGQLPDLGVISGLVEAEWALSFVGAVDGVEEVGNVAELTLPLAPILKALEACPPGNARDEVVLALTPSSDEGAPPTRYFAVRAMAMRQMLQHASQGPVCVPSCIELLRVAMGLSQKVRLQRTVREVLDSALRAKRSGQSQAVPANLTAQLRNYQLQGFQWLASNARNGVGSILADDMGLGKTLQTITLLQHLREIGRIGPGKHALVVAPFSVLSCWHREILRWAPDLRCHVYHGKQRSAQLVSDEDGGASSADVLLTTYGTMQVDEEKLCADSKFACIVLDESQVIKNPRSLTSKAAKNLAKACGSSCVRVALSGTPIENRLLELHSLFEFLNPGFLGSREDFASTFEKPIQKVANTSSSEGQVSASAGRNKLLGSELLGRLGRAIAPFMLRRMKSDRSIAPELPEKLELQHFVELAPEQRRLYAALAELGLKRVLAPSGEGGEEQPRTTALSRSQRAASVLGLLHKLQQLCNHPAALPAHHWPEGFESTQQLASKAASQSGKAARLLELLSEILEPPREKVLIFTQYLCTLEYLAGLVESSFAEVKAVRFHGGLSGAERDSAAASFSSDPSCAVMVLSLQAGGVGLSLTAATHVVHFDRCWNPAKESQATDRAHRIGQRGTVVVHRLTTSGTLEERLCAVLAGKKALATAALAPVSDFAAEDKAEAGEAHSGTEPVDAARAIADFSDKQLRELFRLSP